ncbi:hypothetical protein HZS_5508 [Henneguya salminicola]|nr:hypothetical protein HZS_5508 [Henneguya salminicola]
MSRAHIFKLKTIEWRWQMVQGMLIKRIRGTLRHFLEKYLHEFMRGCRTKRFQWDKFKGFLDQMTTLYFALALDV